MRKAANACAACPLDHGFHNFLGLGLVLVFPLKEFQDRDTAHAGVTDERHHVVAMAAEGYRNNVFHGNAEFPGNEGCETS